MAVFFLLHLVGALVGIGAAVGLLRPGKDRVWQLSAAMWLSLVAVTGSGIVLTLSRVGTGAPLGSGVLFAKIIATLVLFGLMYASLTDVDAADTRLDTRRLGAILVLWIVLFAMGLVVAR